MKNSKIADHWGIEGKQDYMRISLQTIGRNSSTNVGSFPFEETDEKKKQRKISPVHLLVARGHGDECQAQAQIGRGPGDGEGGEEQCSSL